MERIGAKIGSVSQNKICAGLLPWVIGNQEMITRMKIKAYKNRQK